MSEDQPDDDETSFVQLVEDTFDALVQNGSDTLSRHHFDAMLRLFGMPPSTYQQGAAVGGWAQMENCADDTPNAIIGSELCESCEIGRADAIKFFDTSDAAQMTKPRLPLLQLLFQLMSEEEMLLRDAQKLLRILGIKTTLSDFSLYTRIEIPQEQTGLFMDQGNRDSQKETVVERGQALLESSRDELPPETVKALELLVKNRGNSSGDVEVLESLYTSMAGERLLHEIVQSISGNCHQANGKQLAYLLMSNRKVLDKIGLANCPVTVGALADRVVEIAKKDANGMISTENFVLLYSETVEVIEQNLDNAVKDTHVDNSMKENILSAEKTWAAFLEDSEPAREDSQPEDLDDLIDDLPWEAAADGTLARRSSIPSRRPSVARRPSVTRSPSVARRPSVTSNPSVTRRPSVARRPSLTRKPRPSKERLRRRSNQGRNSIVDGEKPRRGSTENAPDGGQYALRRRGSILQFKRGSLYESERQPRKQSIAILQENRINDADLIMDTGTMTFQQWLLLYSSVSLKDNRLTSNLLDEEEEAVIPAAKLERVIEMLNRLYYLVCKNSFNSKFSADALNNAILAYGPESIPKAPEPPAGVRPSPHRTKAADRTKKSKPDVNPSIAVNATLLDRLKEMYKRFDAGPEWGKCTFIRMLGSDAEDDIPQELLCFVHQIRRLCAAYGLFDEDGGGTIDSLEFGATLTKLFGWRPTRYETEKMMAMAVGTHQDVVTEIDWDGFIKMMTMKHLGAVADKLQEIVVAIGNFSRSFECFDIHHMRSCCSLDFTVHPQDFCQVWSATGLRHSPAEFTQMISNLRRRDLEIRGMDWSERTETDTYEIDFACFVNILTDCQQSTEKQLLEMVFLEMDLMFKVYVNKAQGLVRTSSFLGVKAAEKISVPQIVQFVTVLCGCEHTEAVDAVHELLDEADAQDRVKVSFPFFATLLAGNQIGMQDVIRKRMGELREVYNLFDEHHKGEVDLLGFIEILKKFGGLEPHKIAAAIEQFDTDGNGMLDFAEFTEMMLTGDERIITSLTTHIEMLNEVFSIITVKRIPSTSAFAQALIIVGGMPKADAEAMAKQAWCDSKELDRDSFLKLMFEHNVDQQCNKFKRYLSDLRQSYTMFDTGDGECIIGRQELKITFQLLGFELNDSHINDILAANDVGNGVMSFGAYVAITLPLVLRFRADVFKDKADLQSQVNKLREDFAAASSSQRVPVFSNCAEFEQLMAEPSPNRSDGLAQHVSQFLLDGCCNEAFRRLDPSTRLELCKDVRLLKAAPHACLVEEGEVSEHMLVVLRGAINVYLPQTSLASTDRHEMWCTVQQLLGQIVPRLQLTQTNWPSTPRLPAKLIVRSKLVEKMILGCIRDATDILHDGEEDQHCTEFVDIWTKPILIRKGTRLLAELQSLMQASQECREQCTKLRALLIARPQMQENAGMSTIANMIDCIGDMLTDLKAWKPLMEAIFGELDATHSRKKTQEEPAKRPELLRNFVVPPHVKEVGSVLQGQSFGIQSLTSVHFGMDYEPVANHDITQAPLAVAGIDEGGEGPLVLVFSRQRYVTVLSREPTNFLISQPCFSYLQFDRPTLERLAMTCIPGRHEFGETVVQAGKPANAILLLSKGELKVIRQDAKAKGCRNSRDTISMLAPPTAVDMVQKDSCGKYVQQYTLVAGSANVELWWIKRGLFDDMAKNRSVTDTTLVRNQFYSDQVNLIEQNAVMLAKTAVGQNVKLILESKVSNEPKQDQDTASDQDTAPLSDSERALQSMYKDCLDLKSLSLNGRLMDEAVNRDNQLHLLSLVVHPVPPQVPVTARPDLRQVDVTHKIFNSLPNLQRRKLRTIGFQVGLEDQLGGMSAQRCIALRSPALPKKHQSESPNRRISKRHFIKGFMDSNLKGFSATSHHNRAVRSIADKLKEVERKISLSTGNVLFDCSVAKLKHELNSLLNHNMPMKSPRLPSMKNLTTQTKAASKLLAAQSKPIAHASSVSSAFITQVDFDDEPIEPMLGAKKGSQTAR